MDNNQIVRMLNEVLYELDHSHTERSSDAQANFADLCEELEQFKESFIGTETEYREGKNALRELETAINEHEPRMPLVNAQLERIAITLETIVEAFEQAERTGFNVKVKTIGFHDSF